MSRPATPAGLEDASPVITLCPAIRSCNIQFKKEAGFELWLTLNGCKVVGQLLGSEKCN